MTGTPQRRAISPIAVASSSAWAGLSMTHGPRMKARGCPSPIENEPTRIGDTLDIIDSWSGCWQGTGRGPCQPVVTLLPAAGRRFPPGAHGSRGQRPRLVPMRRFDEARKQRMRPQRARLEFRVELYRDVPRVRRHLRNFDELAVGRPA